MEAIEIKEFEVCVYKTKRSKQPNDAKRYFETLADAENYAKEHKYYAIREITYNKKTQMMFYSFDSYFYKSF